MTKRNYLIDLLRFIAATWVSFMHFNQVVKPIDNWYRDLVSYGYLGVPVFFVISGYCVYLAAEHSRSVKDFIVRRLFRIFPPYWFSILIVGLAVILSRLFYGGNSVTTLPKSITEIIETITLLTVPLTKTQVINWVYWTLIFELFFYGIIAVGFILPALYRPVWLILIGALPYFLPVKDFWFFFFIKHWPEFCLGVLMFRMIHYSRKEISLNIILLIMTLFSLFMLPLKPYYPYATIATAVLILINHYKPLENNFFSRLGDYSYSIYLIHVPLGVYILGSVKQTIYVQTHIWANILWDIFLFSLIVCTAKLIYKFVELPSIRLGKKYSQKKINLIDSN